MIRFRFREDEKRYVSLVSEVYRLVAGSLPPDRVSTVMRNLGKLQDMLMLEGVRQGVAASAISNIAKERHQGDKEELKAFQLHAHIYGSQDTPLRDIELEWLEKLDSKHLADLPWLDEKPMRFAPETEREFQGELRRETSRKAWEKWDQSEIDAEVKPWPDVPDPDQLDFPEELPEDVDLEAAIQALDTDEDAQERPQLLDRIRETLMDFGKTGLRPADWRDLILRLHLALHVDAGALDMQLGTAMGRTVLAQAGFHDLQPGPFGVNLTAIEQQAIEIKNHAVPPHSLQELGEDQIHADVPPDDDSSPEDD